MLRRLSLLVLVFFLTPWALATVSGFLEEQSFTEIRQKVIEAERSYGSLVVKEGEIIAVESAPGSDRPNKFILLEADGREKEYFLEEAHVYINGRSGSAVAFRPVAPGSNFSAVLYFDAQGLLRIVEAWYIGGEAKLISTIESMDGRRLRVVGLETGEIRELTVDASQGCGAEELVIGRSYYFLLGTDGKVRCIYGEE